MVSSPKTMPGATVESRRRSPVGRSSVTLTVPLTSRNTSSAGSPCRTIMSPVSKRRDPTNDASVRAPSASRPRQTSCSASVDGGREWHTRIAQHLRLAPLERGVEVTERLERAVRPVGQQLLELTQQTTLVARGDHDEALPDALEIGDEAREQRRRARLDPCRAPEIDDRDLRDARRRCGGRTPRPPRTTGRPAARRCGPVRRRRRARRARPRRANGASACGRGRTRRGSSSAPSVRRAGNGDRSRARGRYRRRRRGRCCRARRAAARRHRSRAAPAGPRARRPRRRSWPACRPRRPTRRRSRTCRTWS